MRTASYKLSVINFSFVAQATSMRVVPSLFAYRDEAIVLNVDDKCRPSFAKAPIKNNLKRAR